MKKVVIILILSILLTACSTDQTAQTLNETDNYQESVVEEPSAVDDSIRKKTSKQVAAVLENSLAETLSEEHHEFIARLDKSEVDLYSWVELSVEYDGSPLTPGDDAVELIPEDPDAIKLEERESTWGIRAWKPGKTLIDVVFQEETASIELTVNPVAPTISLSNDTLYDGDSAIVKMIADTTALKPTAKGVSIEIDNEEIITTSIEDSQLVVSALKPGDTTLNVTLYGETTTLDIHVEPAYEVDPLAESLMYATRNCNIRSAPDSSSELIGTLMPGQSVTVNGIVNEYKGQSSRWYQIYDNSSMYTHDRNLYVYADFLSEQNLIPNLAGHWFDPESVTLEMDIQDLGNNTYSILITSHISIYGPEYVSMVGTYDPTTGTISCKGYEDKYQRVDAAGAVLSENVFTYSDTQILYVDFRGANTTILCNESPYMWKQTYFYKQY